MHPLFVQNPRPTFDAAKAYALATLLRGMEFDSGDYLSSWGSLMGANLAADVRPASGWPLPYTVYYHPDGVILAFSGLRNLVQALQYWENTRLTQYYNCTGRVMNFVRMMHEAIWSAVLAKYDAAPNKIRITLCGHSAGGSLAAVMYSHFKAIHPSVEYQLFTFGSPRVGDWAFASSVTHQAWEVMNAGDVVPAFPYFTVTQVPFTTVPRAVDVPVNPGKPIVVNATGHYREGSSWFGDPALPRLVLNLLNNPALPQGVAHQIGTYADRLRANGEAMMQRDEWTPIRNSFTQLNQAINAGVLLADKLTPTVERVHTTVSTPPAPTLPQAQTMPTNDGNPIGPVTFPGDNSIVARTDRVYSSATTTRSSLPPVQRAINGTDRRLLERMLFAVEYMLQHDTEINLGKRNLKTVSGQPFFGPTHAARYQDAITVKNYLINKLAQEFITVS